MICALPSSPEYQYIQRKYGHDLARSALAYNNANPMDLAPNGKKSRFYHNLLELTGSSTKAEIYKMLSLTKPFDEKYGNRETGEYTLRLDENNEPIAQDVIAYLVHMENLSLAPVGNMREKIGDIADKLFSSLGLSWEWDPSLTKEYGKNIGNNVYLNPNKIRIDTPFHEFAHPVVRDIRRTNKKLYNELVAELPASEIAFTSTVYKHLNHDDMIEEAVLQYFGKLAAHQYMQRELEQSQLNWLQKIVKAIVDRIEAAFGIKVEPNTITSKPFAEVYDILMGNREFQVYPASEELNFFNVAVDEGFIDNSGKVLNLTGRTILIESLKEHPLLDLKLTIKSDGLHLTLPDGSVNFSIGMSAELHETLNKNNYRKSKENSDNYTSSKTSLTLNAVGKMLRMLHPNKEMRNLSDEEAKKYNAERLAEKAWQGQDKSIPQIVDGMTPMTYEQAIQHYITSMKDTTTVGRAFHKIYEAMFMEYMDPKNRAQEIESTIQEAKEMIQGLESRYMTWNKFYKQTRAVFTKNDGTLDHQKFRKLLNFSKTDLPFTEQTIASEALGMSGTVDLFIKHYNNTYSIKDIKSSDVRELQHTDNIRFSNIPISSASMNDLQVTLYALIAKSNKPDMLFRNLQVIYNDAHGLPKTREVNLIRTLPIIKDLLINEGHAKFVQNNEQLFVASNYKSSVLDEINGLDNMSDEEALFEVRRLISEIVDPGNLNKGRIDDLGREANNPEVRRLLQQYADMKAGMERKEKTSLDQSDNKDMSWLFKIFGYAQVAGSSAIKAVTASWNKGFDEFQQEIYELESKHRYLLRNVMRDIDGSGLSAAAQYIRTDVSKYTSWMWTKEGNIVRFIKESDPDFAKKVNTPSKKAYYKFYKESFLDYSTELLKDPNSNVEIASKLPGYVAAVKKKELYTVYIGKTDQENSMFDTLKESNYKYKDIRYRMLDFVAQEDSVDEVKYRIPLRNMRPKDATKHSYDTERIFMMHMTNLVWKKHMDPNIELFNAIRNALPKDAGGNYLSPRNAQFLANFTETKLLNLKKYSTTGINVVVKMKTKDGREITRKKKVYLLDAILDGLRQWINYAVMPLRPVLFVRNLLMEQSFNSIMGMTGTAKSMLADDEGIFFNNTDLLKAHGILARSALDMDVRRKIINLGRKYKFSVDFNYEFDNSTRLLNKSIFKESSLFITSSAGEQYSAMTAMIATMIHDGMWDNYDSQANYIGKERFKIRTATGLKSVTGYTSQETNRIREIISRIHGSYSKERSSHVEAYAGGRLMLQFKKYLINFGIKLFIGQYNSEALGRFVKAPFNETNEEVFEWEAYVEEGSLRVILRSIVLFSKHGLDLFNNKELQQKLQLSPIQLQNLYELGTNVAVFAASTVAMDQLFDNDDDDKNQKNLLYRELKKLVGDLVGIYSLQEWGKAASTPSIAIKRLVDIIDATLEIGEKYKTTSDIYGYKKGEDKGWNKLYRLVPPFSSAIKEYYTLWALFIDADDVPKRYRPSEIAFKWEYENPEERKK